MSKTEAIKDLKAAQDNTDTENAHFEADAVLCKFLIELGYQDVVVEYQKVSKWYS